jgi:hypothetical protein
MLQPEQLPGLAQSVQARLDRAQDFRASPRRRQGFLDYHRQLRVRRRREQLASPRVLLYLRLCQSMLP